MGEDSRSSRKAWESPELKNVGDVGEVVQQGGAKLSTDNPEPGELATKPPGQ
jgi:hypothetical protein